ncbi:uncharacterized protein CIMG_13655 [Coccidioides immitis RS]|uniref:Uncharacterized protein n=1 Tax=Coccidioides immitis (strain RS) TaxID=246410 RepID=J3KAA8_COCIM|nr:uncharacterized protein CIMG_13655 [Coccidioides immitis RS]EAS31940.3 hypothetical protein CIMG_13655 [Coccidioides immitis RS]
MSSASNIYKNNVLFAIKQSGFKLFEAQNKLEHVKQETLSYLLHLQKQKKLLCDWADKFLESKSKFIEDLEYLKKEKQKRVAEQTEIQSLLALLDNSSFSDSLSVVSDLFINALLMYNGAFVNNET